MTEYYEPTIDINPSDQDRENKLVNKALTKYPIPYISGLKLQEDIRLGNLVFNKIEYPNPVRDSLGTLFTDPNRPVNNYKYPVVWIANDVDGWWNLPDPELPDLIRGWGDGSYDAKGRFASRLLTLAGTFLTQDPEDTPKARTRLLSAVNLVYRGDWLIVNEDIAKGAFVRLSGRPEIATVNARGRTEFSIGLRAADPVKYEYIDGQDDGYNFEVITPVNGQATATITNDGNISVPILIELSAGFLDTPTEPEAGTALIPVKFFQRSEGAITLQFFSAHPFKDGDFVYLDQIHPSMNGFHIVSVADIDDFNDILQIIDPGVDIPISPAGSSASVSLSPGLGGPATITNTATDQVISIIRGTAPNNRLEIDTYNREILDVEYATDPETGEEVVVEVSNGRFKAFVLIDWIYLEPGENTITLGDFPSGSTCTIYYRSGWIG